MVGVIPRIVYRSNVEAWVYLTMIFAGLLAVAIYYNEARDVQKEQPYYKTITDLLMWFAGYTVMVIPW